LRDYDVLSSTNNTKIASINNREENVIVTKTNKYQNYEFS